MAHGWRQDNGHGELGERRGGEHSPDLGDELTARSERLQRSGWEVVLHAAGTCGKTGRKRVNTMCEEPEEVHKVGE